MSLNNSRIRPQFLGGRWGESGTLSVMRGGERPNEGSFVAALLEELIYIYIVYTDINICVYIYIYVQECIIAP